LKHNFDKNTPVADGTQFSVADGTNVR